MGKLFIFRMARLANDVLKKSKVTRKMRKSLWMTPLVLLFTACGSTLAHADTIVSSGGNVTAIDGITIDGNTYNATFGTTDSATFASSLTDATLAAEDVANDLSTPNLYLTAGGFTYLGVDGGGNSPSICQELSGTCNAGSADPWGSVGANTTAIYATLAGKTQGLYKYGWVDFSVQTQATPEPGTLTLALTGVGLLGSMVVLRKRVALRHSNYAA